MNYTWDYLIHSIHKNVYPAEINLYKAEDYSPYMELSFHDINFHGVDTNTEINVYYRDSYTAIFKYLFEPDLNEAPELRKHFTDILLHLLFETDRFQGMSRREYYIRFLIKELQNDVYGQEVVEQFKNFTFMEQIAVANGLLSLYRTGENMAVLRRVTKDIFPNSFLFGNTRERNELYFYLRTEETSENWNKIRCIITLFMPFRFAEDIYWEDIFGVQDMEVFMKQGEFLQF